MTVYNKAAVGRAAKEIGFPRDTFEKVLPQSIKVLQREDFILKAIDYYAKHL